MSDKNELVKLDDLGGLKLQKYDDAAFDATASSASFLPRLQLMTSNAGKCKSGEFPTNHYALISDQKFTDLGKNVDVLLVAWRPKALETGENVISVYDPADKEFERIQDKSLNVKNSGCMFGPEFLCWVGAAGKFTTFFMGTKSSRRESGAVKALMQKQATLGSQLCKNKSFEWFAPQVSACTTPGVMPGKEDLVNAVEKFNNPPKSDVEGVEEAAETRAR